MNAAQVEIAEEDLLERPSLIIDSGSEQSADLVSNSADMIAWKKKVPTWGDITTAMKMPHYHVVVFGNRLPSTMCKAVAVLPQLPRCYPYNNGRDCGPQGAASAHVTRARRRTGSRRRRMEQRCLLGGLRSGALKEGRERRTQRQRADDEAGRTRGPSGRSKGRDSDES